MNFWIYCWLKAAYWYFRTANHEDRGYGPLSTFTSFLCLLYPCTGPVSAFGLYWYPRQDLMLGSTRWQSSMTPDCQVLCRPSSAWTLYHVNDAHHRSIFCFYLTSWSLACLTWAHLVSRSFCLYAFDYDLPAILIFQPIPLKRFVQPSESDSFKPEAMMNHS